MTSAFLHEAEVYALAARAGLRPPRHAFIAGDLPFAPGEPVVLKGLAREVWHKSEAGALRFMAFDRGALESAAADMRARIAPDGASWIGALVCERVAIARSEGLPTEAFVSLTRREGIWSLVLGLGGLQAEALGSYIPPLRWPLAWTDRDSAFAELAAHLLGRTWLGRLRGTRPLTTEPQLRRFLEALFSLAALAEEEGLDLLEMNPVVLDPDGEPRPLDGVGQRAAPAPPIAPSPPAFLTALLAPRRVAVAGVSAKADGVGHIVVDNLRAADWPEGDLVILKPDADRLLDLPCVPDARALATAPVDLLLVALPAPAAVALLEQLIAQGGGATVVALVAGGLGDGADHEGLGARVRALLGEARAHDRWTPAVLGPNFLGHAVPGRRLHTTFIPADRWRPPTRPGPLALLSQSGAFVLSRLDRARDLPLGLFLALGNQLDVRLSHVLAALADAPAAHALTAIAAYVEGFAPGELAATAHAARRLAASGRTVILYRAGRTAAGQSAAASHTGALAGDLTLETAVLSRADVHLVDRIADFDSAITWLAHYPTLRPGPVALVSNAGFETVSGADRLAPPFTPATLSAEHTRALTRLLEHHGLASLVSPRLPLDLTPMADLDAYRDALELVLETDARVVIVGLVPFTRRLDLAALAPLTRSLRAAADARGKAIALVIDAAPGDLLDATAGLPTFSRVEDAIAGLTAITPR